MDTLPDQTRRAGERWRRRIRSTAFQIGLSLLLALGSVPAAGAFQGAAAQEAGTEAQLDSLRAEIAELKAQLDSLRSALTELSGREAEEAREAEEDALTRLRAAAQAAAAAGAGQDTAGSGEEGRRQFVGRQRSLQALNPEISLNGDIFGRIGDDPDSNNFIPREFELSLQSTLDPYSRAKIFIAYEEEGTGIEPFEGVGGHGHGEEEEGGTEIHVEEAYAEWVSLPGGLGLKAGRFFQQFGTLNRWHAHALPFQSHSLPHLTFIGAEGLSQTGASVHWLAPVSGFGTWEITGEVGQAGNEALWGESDGLTYLGHLNAFFQMTPSTSLDLKASAVFGDHVEGLEEFSQRLYGAEFALNWLPPGRSLYREFLLRGGVMWLDPGAPAGEAHHEDEGGHEEEGEEHAAFVPNATGFWSMAEFKFARQWRVGARVDWVENPFDPDQTAWLVSPTLTWWQSEWVRLRAEYDHLDRGDETIGQFLLQVTFAMGPHKHETY